MRFCTYNYNIFIAENKSQKDKLIIDGRFEWFEIKNNDNITKHGYSFKDVEPIFDDPYFYEIYDVNHSTDNQHRFFGLGCIAQKFLVLQVAYTEETDRIHLISARDATSNERKMYYEKLRELYR